jgi:hypothetical protein
MQDQVVQWLGLQDISDYNETLLVPQLLQQGTIDLLTRTRCTVRCVQLRVHANVEDYLLDQAILALVDVEDGARRRARRDESTYGFVLIRSDVLRIEPTPSEDGTVRVWAVMLPQAMAADADSPGDEAFGAIPEECHDAIVTYALWKGADYSDDAGSQQGERYRVMYEGQDGRGGRLSQIRTTVNKRGTARAPRRRIVLPAVSSSGTWTG